MIDIKFLRENPEVVKQNIRNKFQDAKLPLVDEVIALDEELRQNKKRADDLRANRNKISKSIGMLMGQKRFEEAEEAKKLVAEQAAELAACEAKEAELSVITDAGTMIRTSAANIPTYSRSAGGVRVMRLAEGQKIVNFTKLARQDELEEVVSESEALPEDQIPETETLAEVENIDAEAEIEQTEQDTEQE